MKDCILLKLRMAGILAFATSRCEHSALTTVERTSTTKVWCRDALVVFTQFITLPILIIASPAIAEEATRIYYIGNSLTQELIPDKFEKLVKGQGIPYTWGRHILGGSRINDIWEKAGQVHGYEKPFGSWNKALRDYQWDVMTLQPFYYPFEPQFEAALQFSQLLIQRSPDAQIYVYAQWPQKAEGPDWDLGFTRPQLTPTYLKTKPDFTYEAVVKQLPAPLATRYQDRSLRHQYEALVYGLRQNQVSRKPALLIPVGHVMQLLGQKMRAGLLPGYKSPYDFYSDEVHVNNDASYIIACTFFATIFHASPIGLPFNEYQGKPGSRKGHVIITPELAKIIQESVWEVVATHQLTGVTSTQALKVATPRLDPAVAGEQYHFELTPAFGRGPYQWKLANGTIPEGILLSTDGMMNGVANVESVTRLTLQVTDSQGQTAQHEFPFTVEQDTAPQILAQTLPSLALGSYQDVPLKSSGGNGVVRWSLKEGNLPPGIQLRPEGILSGSAGKTGKFDFTLQVVDSDTTHPEMATGTFTLVVGPAQEEIVVARRLARKPVFDGDPSKNDWQLRYDLKKLVQGSNPAISGKFDVAWDDENLYVALKVTDPTLKPGTIANQMNGDYVIFCIDALNNRQATYNADDRYCPFPRSSRFPNRDLFIGDDGTEARQKELVDGYFIEFKISLYSLGLVKYQAKAKPFTVLGLDVMIIDDAEKCIPHATVVWKGTADNAQDPSQFGTVILGE